MDMHLLREVLNCLRGERTVFYYCQDQYALYLIRRLVAKHGKLSVRDLRQSRWSTLLNRPAMKEVIADCGSGFLYKETLIDRWPTEPEPFILTLGEWGNNRDWTWEQTSRPGSNLVLQLNLCKKWSQKFRHHTKESANSLTGYHHPVSESRAATLAWARLDLDFDTDEVLIEEIQSDLIKEVIHLQEDSLIAKKDGVEYFDYYGEKIHAKRFLEFSCHFLSTFKKIWQEAILAASIFFAFEELGCSKLYYHSFDTGNTMKNLKWSKPPRSLYTELPKKFCFEQTVEAPRFLLQEKRLRRKLKKLENGCWFHMAA